MKRCRLVSVVKLTTFLERYEHVLITCCLRVRSFGMIWIRDHSDYGRANELVNRCPEWIHRFIWSTMIRVISDHWSWSGSSHPKFSAFSWERILIFKSACVNMVMQIQVQIGDTRRVFFFMNPPWSVEDLKKLHFAWDFEDTFDRFWFTLRKR